MCWDTLFIFMKSNLIELQHVEQFEQLPILLAVLQFDVVLAQAVKRQLCLIIDVDFHRLRGLGSRG